MKEMGGYPEKIGGYPIGIGGKNQGRRISSENRRIFAVPLSHPEELSKSIIVVNL